MYSLRRAVICAALLVAAATVGCGGSSARRGALYVRVVNQDTTPVADAQVTTDPATAMLITDALGTVIFPKIAAGFYTVTAAHPTRGAGRIAVRVVAEELADVTVILNGQVVDAAVDAPRSDGGADVRVDVPRTEGGQDASADTGTDLTQPMDSGMDAAPSGSIVLATPTKDSNGINLSWSIAPGNTFSSYRVYRASSAGAFEVLNIVNAPSTLVYRDEAPILGMSYRYRIGGTSAGAAEVFSNEQTIVSGVYIAVNTQIERMRTDPKRAYLYAIDRVNNTLHFVNLTTNAVEKSIFIGSSPVDLAINLTGTELYVANFGSTEISVVNLDTREKVRSLFVDTSVGTWDGNPYRLVCTAGNTLVFTSMDQWNDLKLVNAATGSHIKAVGSLYTPQLAASPDGTRLYVSGGFDPVTRFDVTATTLTQVDTSTVGGGTVSATKDGMYVFSGAAKVLANNLKSVLGTFSESILVTNADGSIAIGPSKIHNGTTFATTRSLPLMTSIMALGSDDKTLYLYDTMSSRIYFYKLP